MTAPARAMVSRIITVSNAPVPFPLTVITNIVVKSLLELIDSIDEFSL